jgi:6-pyruvoyl-tetrahydropterin synthase
MTLLAGIAGDFIASQQEPGARLEANLAGHNYRLGVDVAGPLNEQTGLIAPRLTVDRALRSTLAHFDHHDLGNLAGRGLPSAECLVRAAWQEISVVCHRESLSAAWTCATKPYRARAWILAA